MEYSEKYGYAPDREKMDRALNMIAANLDNLASEQVYKDCFSMMDLTTLKTDDTPASVTKLVEKVNVFHNTFPEWPYPASVCVFSNFASTVKNVRKGDFNMAFSFDGLTKKAKDIAALAADKTKDAADTVKINVAIAGEQREIDKNYRAIGEWFVNEYEGEIPEAVREIVEAVAASKTKIAELEASKEKAEEPVIEAEAEVLEEEIIAKACPVCGNEANSKFCPQCGAPMGE